MRPVHELAVMRVAVQTTLALIARRWGIDPAEIETMSAVEFKARVAAAKKKETN